MSTSFHAKYYAHELTRRCSAHQLDKLNKSILNASVDLNPHQLDAAMFAFRSPLSRGAILADEVGLGKTIEAGLIISQLWAERKRRILVIVPASLRKQWERELLDKFYIGSAILETRNHNRLVREGNPRPFEQTDQVLICSYNFARAKADDLTRIAWDLVVIDEAHRLRNVYKQGNKIARAIRDAIGSAPKVLLTATPLQNNLLELHGLVSFLDPHVFGSVESFREQFIRIGSWDDQKYHILPAKTRIEMVLGAIPRKEVNYDNLRARLQPFCQRTLRRQVTEYIRYTNRISLTQDFTPTNEEVRLYESVSAYLQRGATFALPSSQRALLTLVMRKILASSSFAITATLARLIERLEAMGGAAAGAESRPRWLMISS